MKRVNPSQHHPDQHHPDAHKRFANDTFTVTPTHQFNGPFPFYRQPVEMGHFSLDGDRIYHNNAQKLRYYKPPKSENKLNFNLRDGYDTAVLKDDEVKERLHFLLKWLSKNTSKFASDEKDRTAKEKRLNTDFVAWRGHFTKFLCTPYENREPWQMAACKFNGTIYISEVETAKSKNDRENRTPIHEEMCYWGYKFEDYVTQPIVEPLDPSPVVNTNEAFATVVRTRLNKHSLLCGAEVDCCIKGNKSTPPANYIELKTSRIMQNHRQKENFARFKLLRIWAQSFLAGIPQVIVGMRDDDGIVKHLESFKTMKIPNECKNYQKQWDASLALNFLDKFLGWLKDIIVVEDPKTVYMLYFNPPFQEISYKVIDDGSQTFLPPWYIDGQTDC